MPRQKREYTDDEIAGYLATLRANGGNAKRTANQLGVPLSTLRGWAGLNVHQSGTPKKVSPSAVDAKSEKLASRFDAIGDKITKKVLDALDSIELKNATDIKSLLIGSGITTEKASFARGGPTSRVESLKVSLIDPVSLRSGALKVIEGGKKASKVA